MQKKKKKKGGGEGEGEGEDRVSTVLQREQWSLHCSRCRTVDMVQKKKKEKEKKKEKGKGKTMSPLFFNVNSGVSTVHVAEQWTWCRSRRGRGRAGNPFSVILQGAPLFTML